MDRLKFLNQELGTDLISLDEINWGNISRNKQLSEDFIREFQNEINWDYISNTQNLSENF